MSDWERGLKKWAKADKSKLPRKQQELSDDPTTAAQANVIITQTRQSDIGIKSGKARKKTAEQSRKDVITIAERLLKKGVSKRNLASETEKQYELSERRIRDILKEEKLI